jgi:hypothetical protein
MSTYGCNDGGRMTSFQMRGDRDLTGCLIKDPRFLGGIPKSNQLEILRYVCVSLVYTLRLGSSKSSPIGVPFFPNPAAEECTFRPRTHVSVTTPFSVLP